ncbi:MAG: molybdopterin-dependent oxidoreductase [Clostridiales Family XIII bacterium]|jgi:hypothetical protein|nr:molybdopterin-dependent oxidoreductase [Clostridiales Family XIII bacterium]
MGVGVHGSSRRFLAGFASVAVSFAIIASLLSGCTTEPSKLRYLDEEIAVSGLTGEEFTVTVGELTALDAVSKKAEGLRSNGDVVKFTAVGPTIDTFLEAYGKSRADFTGVRFSATDGYSVIIPKELFEKREIVLAYMNGGRALDRKNAPLRAIVIDERAMYWARMIDRIEFQTGDEATTTRRIVFLDTVLPALKGAYSEEEGGDIVSVIDLFGRYGGMSEGGKVYLSAYDGLKKNETIENFLKGYIKYTGEKTPQFCSPDLPPGMNMDGIVRVHSEGIVYFSLARASELFSAKTFDGQDGIGVGDIIRETGFLSSNAFRLEDVNGETKLVSGGDMSAGVFVEEGGSWTFLGPDGLRFENVALFESADADMGQ